MNPSQILSIVFLTSFMKKTILIQNSIQIILCIWLPCFKMAQVRTLSFPGVLDGKESACNAGDLGSVPVSERSPGERNGYPLQYSCLENSMDREA